METINDNIIITNWACDILFCGAYYSDEVDIVLKANRCQSCISLSDIEREKGVCLNCDNTAYFGDIEIFWQNYLLHKDDNVYDFINY